MVEVATGSPLTAVDPVRGAVSDPGAALGLVRVQVMGALATRLSPVIGWEPVTTRPPTFESFQAYSRAMEEWIRGDFASSAEWCERAYVLDPTYLRALALAAAALANVGAYERQDSLLHLLEPGRGDLSPFDRARVEFMHAELRGESAAALAAARRKVELSPVSTTRFALIWSLSASNRPHESY